jgi:hypothetical protein
MFYVAPLFLIALLAWIERGMPRPARGRGAQRSSPRRCPARSRSPADRHAGEADTLALLPLWWLQDA